MFDFIKQNPFLWLIIFLLIVSPSFLFGAFQVVAIVIFIIMILAVVGILLLRWKVYKFQKQMQDAAQNGAEGANTSQKSSSRFRSTHRAADDIDIKIYSSQSEKKVADDVGDYVEFEEVKSDK